MNNKELAHRWAQQEKASGKGSNMFFDGPSIYSYGRHFEIARFVDAETVLYTTRDYSVSTSKHKGYTRQAVSHKLVFTVPSFDNHGENLEHYRREIERVTIEAGRARTRGEFLLGERAALIKEMTNYLDYFFKGAGTDSRIGKITGEASRPARAFLKIAQGVDLSQIKKVAAETLAKAREAENKRKAARAAFEAEHLEKWRKGENAGVTFETTALRVYSVGGERLIESTHGARVPLSEAVGLYRAIKAGDHVHGWRIGSYTVTSVSKESIKIGCHDIPLAELDRTADILGLDAAGNPAPALAGGKDII